MNGLDETLPSPGGSSTADALAPGTQAAGRYRIVRFLGAGGVGEVYAAEDLIVGTTVALKTLRPELAASVDAIARFRREIALARKVTDRHVCRLHDVGEHAGRVFLTMELLDGTTLADHVRQGGPLSIDDVERIAQQLIAGLAALHHEGIVHRDFKTANVLLVGDRAVITDFGLARSIVDGGETDARLTSESSMLGTPAYMAPEQVEARPATPASDIYALGVVLYELLTGVLPWNEDTAMATATARLHKDPRAPSSVRSGIPARWDAIVLRCLARDPSARFSRVEDVLGAKARPRFGVIAIGAGIVVTIAGGYAITRDDTSPTVVASECPSGASKLAAVWDPITRARIAGRFLTTGKRYIIETWKGHATQFDEHAASWVPAWDAACRADRTDDPMLYGQRLACLEDSLLSLQSYVDSLADPKLDVREFVAGSPAEFSVLRPEQCGDVTELRMQPPPPPVANRAEIAALVKESTDLRNKLRASTWTKQDPTSRSLLYARLDAIEQRCIELGGPAAAGEIAYWRINLSPQGPDTDRKIASLIELAERTRNDALLVLAIHVDVTNRMGRQPLYDHAAAEAALSRARQIVEHVGNPHSLRLEVAEARLLHEMRARRFDDAVHASRDFITLWGARTRMGVGWRSGILKFRLRHGDVDVAEAKAVLRDRELLVGSAHGILADDLVVVADSLASTRDFEQAHRFAQRAITIAAEPRTDLWQRTYVHAFYVTAFEYAYLAGHRELADRHLLDVIALHGEDSMAAYADLADRMRHRGRRTIAEHVIARAVGAARSDEERAKLAIVSAELQLEAGATFDDSWSARLAKLPELDRNKWLALIEARSGRAARALSHAAAIGDDDSRELTRARVLLLLGRAKEVVPLLERAVSKSDPDQRASGLQSLWLGQALLDSNDAGIALRHLENAAWLLGTRSASAADARFAWGRALVASGGDRAKARQLAATAHQAFVAMELPARARPIEIWLATL